jgi:hypothetical protein
MNQPHPKVSDADVERVAKRDYPAEDLSTVHSILSGYGKEDWQREVPRVRLAILKLADGNLDQLLDSAEVATKDHRDVLATAEYPRYCREIGFDEGDKEKTRTVIADDWRQYREWLEKTSAKTITSHRGNGVRSGTEVTGVALR